MQIVQQTEKRSGWTVRRTLAALGVPSSVYYVWKNRESLEDRAGKPCRVYELLAEERAAICECALQYPQMLSEADLDDGRRRSGLRRKELLRDPAFKAYYARQISEGKRHGQAFIALARRRCEVLLVMLRSRILLDKNLPVQAATAEAS